MKFVPVPVEKLDDMWSEISVELQKPVEIPPNKVDLESVLDHAKKGVYLIWTVLEGEKVVSVVTTRIIDYPRGKSMAMDFVGGTRMKEWLPMVMKVLDDHAKHNKVKFLEAYGREAWLRYLAKYGWNKAYTTFHKDLNYE